MSNYKHFLEANKHKEHLVFQRQLDGSVKFYSFHGTKYVWKKYELKPKSSVLIYSRYTTDSSLYKEFDMSSFLNYQLRSLNHHIIKKLPNDFQFSYFKNDHKNSNLKGNKSTMKTQPRVAIYYRINHSGNLAPLHDLEAYAKENGLEPTIYLDIDSGVGERPALTDLLNLVRSQKVDIIITHSLSRFSRKTSEVTAIFNELEKYNVKLVIPGQLEVAPHE